MTITDMSGRNLSGHSVEAFWYTVRHARPLTIGLNCAFGADLLRPACSGASARSPTRSSWSIPTPACRTTSASTTSTRTPPATFVGEWVAQGLVNIVGGCCGSTPAHIAAMAAAVAGKPPRAVAHPPSALRLAGLDPMVLSEAA